jgi:hypothetical protein
MLHASARLVRVARAVGGQLRAREERADGAVALRRVEVPPLVLKDLDHDLER